MHRTHGCRVIRLKSVYHVGDELFCVHTLSTNPLCEIDMWLSKPTHVVDSLIIITEMGLVLGKQQKDKKQESCVRRQTAHVVCSNVSTELSVSWNPYLWN